jgi:hypothetical protein
MLRDDSSDGGRRKFEARNALGEPLEICSIKPTTGLYRDGCYKVRPTPSERASTKERARQSAFSCAALVCQKINRNLADWIHFPIAAALY